MRKLLIILCTHFAVCCSALGQTMDDIGLIAIGVEYPEAANEETAQHFERLNKKITKAITKNGCASYNDCQFLCIPQIDIDNLEVAEGGMKNVYMLNGTITITAIDSRTGIVFSTTTDAIKGHATSKDKALANAIVESTLNNFNSGIEALKEKICSYYRKNKEVLFTQAQSIADMGNYDEAISILMDFPSIIVPDYYDCLNLANDIYEQKLAELERKRIAEQRERNNSILTKANNAIAASKPEEALQLLMDYKIGIEDQDSQYDKLRQKAQNNISAEKRLEYERQERAYRDAREDKAKDYELAHKRIDTQAQLENKRIDVHQQIENKKLDVAREQTQAAERIENKRIDAVKYIVSEQTQAAERIESKRIDALREVALSAKKNK